MTNNIYSTNRHVCHRHRKLSDLIRRGFSRFPFRHNVDAHVNIWGSELCIKRCFSDFRENSSVKILSKFSLKCLLAWKCVIFTQYLCANLSSTPTHHSLWSSQRHPVESYLSGRGNLRTDYACKDRVLVYNRPYSCLVTGRSLVQYFTVVVSRWSS